MSALLVYTNVHQRGLSCKTLPMLGSRAAVTCAAAAAGWPAQARHPHRDLQWQTDQIVRPGRHRRQVKPLDEPDSRPQKRPMCCHTVVNKAADREIIDPDRTHFPPSQKLRGPRADIDEFNNVLLVQHRSEFRGRNSTRSPARIRCPSNSSGSTAPVLDRDHARGPNRGVQGHRPSPRRPR